MKGRLRFCAKLQPWFWSEPWQPSHPAAVSPSKMTPNASAAALAGGHHKDLLTHSSQDPGNRSKWLHLCQIWWVPVPHWPADAAQAVLWSAGSSPALCLISGGDCKGRAREVLSRSWAKTLILLASPRPTRETGSTVKNVFPLRRSWWAKLWQNQRC